MALLAIFITALLVGLDQFTKFFAVKYLHAVDGVVVLEGILSFTLVENRGAAFGIMQGGRWFFVSLTFVVLAFIVYYYRSLPRTKTAAVTRCTLVLIAAGATGNFIDRLWKGYVVDFLYVSFIDFPVFNVADIYVVLGTFSLAILLLFFFNDDKRAGKQTEEDD